MMERQSPSRKERRRKYRRVRWRTPQGGKRRPPVIEATRAALVSSLEKKEGPLWTRIRKNVPVTGYPKDEADERQRSLRSQGLESLLALAVNLLYLVDIRLGFIGRPRDGGGPWHRYTWADIAQLAYGAQTEAEIKRAQRAYKVMVWLGWAFPTKQVRDFIKEKEAFRSEPGIRWLNLDRLCHVVGTTWLLKRDRKAADAKYGPRPIPTPVISHADRKKNKRKIQELILNMVGKMKDARPPEARGDPEIARPPEARGDPEIDWPHERPRCDPEIAARYIKQIKKNLGITD